MSADEEAERLETGEAFAWRLSIAACREFLGDDAWATLHFMEEGTGPDAERGVVMARPETLGDVILGRKDVGTSYHLACVHDDALQGVSHVIRGQDLFFATHLHVLLQRLLGLPRPIYRHHDLLVGEDGKRFAKRDKSLTIQSLREAGKTPRRGARDGAVDARLVWARLVRRLGRSQQHQPDRGRNTGPGEGNGLIKGSVHQARRASSDTGPRGKHRTHENSKTQSSHGLSPPTKLGRKRG